MSPNQEVETVVDHIMTPELESLPDLGTEIEEGGFSVRAANHPIAHSLANVYSALGKSLETSGIRLYDRFQVLIVPHRVSIIRRSGIAEPTSVGIEVEYLTDGATCCVVGLLPSFEYTELGGVSAGLKTSVSGSLLPTGEISQLTGPKEPQGGAALDIGGLSFNVTGGVAASVNFSANVATPSVAAIGIGSNRAEWKIDRAKEPLFGRDIETWSILVIPKEFDELKYRLRFSITTRTVFFPTRRESDWLDLTCVFA